jgi:hypothetical protein
MAQNFKHVSVLDMRYWSDSQRIHVWPEIFWMDNRTFGRVKMKLRDLPVERAGEVSGVGLWGFDEKVEIVLEE